MTGVRGGAAARRTCVRAVLGVALVAALLSACGVPTMDQPRAIDRVAAPTRAAQGSSADALTRGGTAELFFVSGEQMLRAVRRVQAAGTTPTLIADTLAQLVAGPDALEQNAGLSTAIPPGLTLRLVRLSDRQAVVDLVGTDPGPAADQAHLATGQVVLTLTALPGVDSVTLTRNGRPLEAALPDGELTRLPLTQRDFAALVQR